VVVKKEDKIINQRNILLKENKEELKEIVKNEPL